MSAGRRFAGVGVNDTAVTPANDRIGGGDMRGEELGAIVGILSGSGAALGAGKPMPSESALLTRKGE
jgi:hypothetical protein